MGLAAVCLAVARREDARRASRVASMSAAAASSSYPRGPVEAADAASRSQSDEGPLEMEVRSTIGLESDSLGSWHLGQIASKKASSRAAAAAAGLFAAFAA